MGTSKRVGKNRESKNWEGGVLPSAGPPYIYVLTGLLDFLSGPAVESNVLPDTVDNLASTIHWNEPD